MELSNPKARRVLAAGCVCGLLASLTLPWDMLSSGLFALTSVLLAVGCAMLRGQRSEYGRPIKPAVAAAGVPAEAPVRPSWNWTGGTCTTASSTWKGG